MSEKQMIIEKLDNEVIENIERLESVDVNDWVTGLLTGKLGFQSGNTDLIYIINKNNRLRRVEYNAYSFKEGNSEPISYLDSYFLNRTSHLYFLTDSNNLKNKELKKYIFKNIKNSLPKNLLDFDKGIVKDFDENLV
jgi:hypothetical protein